MSEENPLEFIETDELIKELERRHDSGVLCFSKNLNVREEHVKSHWWGGVSAIGCAHLLLRKVTNEYVATFAEGEEDE